MFGLPGIVPLSVRTMCYMHFWQNGCFTKKKLRTAPHQHRIFRDVQFFNCEFRSDEYDCSMYFLYG